MSAQLKLANVNTHVVDILGSVKGRDQPVMKMDKAVELVKCLEEEVFINEDYVFFDPFCKAGEILLATALVSILYKTQKKLFLLDTVYKEIYQNDRYFALAPDERHYNLSLRTFYGNEKSHDKNFTQNIKNGGYLSETDGRLDKTKFNKELKAMLEYIKEKTGNKKIIAIGNPPYQENDGGGNGKSAKPIYNIFFESLVNSKQVSQLNLVIPSRWFTEGKGLDKFRKNIINCKKIRKIEYFENSRSVFPSVDISGGICFINWCSDFTGKTKIKNNGKSDSVDLSRYDVIVPALVDQKIVDKILQKSPAFVKDICWPRNPFGISDRIQDIICKEEPNVSIYYYDKSKKITTIPIGKIGRNRDKIYSYQVAYPKATINRKRVIRPYQFFILNKGEASSGTYSVAGDFSSLNKAKTFLSYLQTDFAMYFFGLRKISQNISQNTWSWVPYMEVKKQWDNKSLFKYFDLTKKEQEHIQQKVKEWS